VLKAFADHINREKLFDPDSRLLLAVSGGIDSVVLAHLLKKCGYPFSLAHCNFGLRKKDSDHDEEFCRQLAQQLGVEIYVKSFDVNAYRKKKKLSVQMAARELRYLWFKDLIIKKKFDYLLTAHHGNDMIETALINFLRGTGINGLKGIPEKAGQIVRPLLTFTKEQILAYATENKISFRLDKSNNEDKYERNFLRLNIVPAFKKLHPGFEKTALENISNFREEAGIVNDFIIGRIENLVTVKGDMLYLDTKSLLKEKYRKTILHAFLYPLGFNSTQAANIDKNISQEGLAGKLFESPSHTLTIDRNRLVIRVNASESFQPLNISSLAALKKCPLLKVQQALKFEIPGKKELILDPRSLAFPLQIRTKKTGDRFSPFGMKGFKLLSDFLKEQKLNNFEKESCKLLVNGNGEIIWVMGYRNDERYKVDPKAPGLLKLSYLE